MIRIGIDCRFAATTSGLGRYTREVVSRLLLHRDQWSYVLFVAPGEPSWIGAAPKADTRIVPIDVGHYTLAEQTVLPDVYRQEKIDLLFVPHFNVPYFCPVPTVVTIHDLILHRYPNQASLLRCLAYRALMHRAVHASRRIIAVSHFTADEIAQVYGEGAKEKTRVVHEGVSAEFAPVSPSDAKPVLERYSIGRPYFLYVGNAKEHKNVPMLLAAYAESGRTDVDLLLVTGGREGKELNLPPGARLLPFVAEKDLPALYSSALACVTASNYEGFGLPLFEAASCGCPVIGTRSGALPEIAPIGSLIVDPSLPALTAALRSPPARRTERPPLPTWDSAAVNTTAVLAEALRG
jgi:glycosyltransferase involved in cell wall biosynthesis